jgi:hypothetical protein
MDNSRHVAIARCKVCGEYLISSAGGDFSYCPCGKSFIDQERMGGLYIRLGGEAELIEQICPKTCTFHKENNKFQTTQSLDEYMLETYNAVWQNNQFRIK